MSFTVDPGITDAECADFTNRLEGRYAQGDMAPGHPERPTRVDSIGYTRWESSYLVKRQTGSSHETATRAVLAEIDAIVNPGHPGNPNPPHGELPELVTAGQFLATTLGSWTAIQCSDFNLLARYQAGEDIRPILAQRSSCGFNLLRVWTLFDIPGIGQLLECAYDTIPAFVSLCATYGLYVEFTAYTGINDPNHWTWLCNAALRCAPRPLLELVNELDQNTNEPDSAGRVFHLEDYSQAPAPLLSAHGSNGSEHWPVQPHWSYATFHTNDASEWWRKVGHNGMEIWAGPTLSNENTRMPDKDASEPHAFDAAAGAALLCAGSCFHSPRGKTSELWDGDELACASTWAAGARSVDLGCQPGPYVHRQDLEGPDDLRVYERPVTPLQCVVHIRK